MSDNKGSELFGKADKPFSIHVSGGTAGSDVPPDITLPLFGVYKKVRELFEENPDITELRVTTPTGAEIVYPRENFDNSPPKTEVESPSTSSDLDNHKNDLADAKEPPQQARGKIGKKIKALLNL